jgi:polyisoprenoid-binding protein YceI
MTATAAPVRLAAGRWTADLDRTRATFTVGNLGVRVVHGTVPVTSGSMEVDAEGRPVSVRAELDLGAIDTGIRRRDLDLRKPALLDLDAHPVMTFAGNVLRPDGAGWSAAGELRLRGTSCPLVVVGRLVEATGNGALRIVGTGVLDRTAIGIRAPRVMIGRSVTITVDAWLTRTPGG